MYSGRCMKTVRLARVKTNGHVTLVRAWSRCVSSWVKRRRRRTALFRCLQRESRLVAEGREWTFTTARFTRSSWKR